MQCLICDENFEHFEFKCSCLVQVCIKCLQKWITINKHKDPNCPNCLKMASMDHIYEIMDGSFLNNQFYLDRSDLLFQNEKYYFIQDMESVNAELKRRNLMIQLRRLYSKKRQLKRTKKNLSEIDREIGKLTNEKSKYLKDGKKNARDDGKILIHCPGKSCRGMILEHNMQCCLCEAKICFDCLLILDANHECAQNDIETAKDIKNNTKPCPNCGIRIYKISGCDQMWCTRCHTTFSFSSGKKMNETMIHNPHYFEYIFHQETNDNNHCTNFLNYIVSSINRNGQLECYRPRILQLVQKIYHYERYILIKYQVDPLRTNSDLRFKYLLNEITEEDMKRILMKREKRNLKKNAVFSNIDILVQSLKDILIRLVNDQGAHFQNYEDEIKKIIQYCYNIGEEINKNYGGNLNEIKPLLIS